MTTSDLPIYIMAECHHLTDEQQRALLDVRKTRRYGRLLKRSIATALLAIDRAGVGMPGAIINGTAMGNLEETGSMLDALVAEGETASCPTQFMLSTHNTVASLLAITTGNHGYNCTYSQSASSLTCALLDAWLQLRCGHIHSALVMTADVEPAWWQQVLERTGSSPLTPPHALALVLSHPREDCDTEPLAELVSVDLLHRPSQQALREALMASRDVHVLHHTDTRGDVSIVKIKPYRNHKVK